MPPSRGVPPRGRPLSVISQTPRPRRLPFRLPGAGVLRVELLAGLVVALALIPEAISFAIIAGVDPKVGLHASFTMAVAISITGGRPAMISAATGNLAIGVGVGVLTSMAVFARRVAHLLHVERAVAPDGTAVTYTVTGQLSFAANQELTDAFHHPDDPPHIRIDMSNAHLWDASAVAALDALTHRYETQGKTVEITGLNRPSSAIHGALSDKHGAV